VKNPRTLQIASVVMLSAICLFVIFKSGIIAENAGGTLNTKREKTGSSDSRATIHETLEKSELKRRKQSNNSNAPKPISIVGFDAADFDAAWVEAIRAGKTDQDQVYNLSLVVGRMSRIGDPERIHAKILETFGPGKSRCHLIGALFMGSESIDGLSHTFSKLEFPDEIKSACAGISHKLCMVDSPEMIDRNKYAFLGDHYDEVLQKSMELYVSRFSSKSEAELSSAVARALSLQTTGESKRNLLSKLARIAPFETWNQLSSNKIELPGTEQNDLIVQMFGRDASRAITKIAEAQDGEKYFSAAMRLWLDNDARKPIEWLEANKANLSTSKRDHAAQGIAEYTARQGDSETAWKWVEQITDPQLRKAAEGRVWSMERDSLRKEVGQDPAGLMQSIIAGQAKYGDYWLEEAMSTWVAKDSDKAQDWYQKNRNSLPANKSQYLAAAFAKQAIGQGDVATARQWAAHIQDARTKQRIEAEIAKAAPNKEN
jgi:hypothetical protein